MPEITYRASVARTLVFSVAWLGFALGLYWLQDEGSAVFYAAIVTTSVVLMWTIYRLFIRGPEQYFLTVQGFSVSRWRKPISWDQVERVLSYTTPVNKHICFVLKDGVVAEPEAGLLGRLVGKINSFFGYGEVWVCTSEYPDQHSDMLKETFDTFCAMVPSVERTDKECKILTSKPITR